MSVRDLLRDLSVFARPPPMFDPDTAPAPPASPPFDGVVPTFDDWLHKLDELTTRGLPFLVAKAGDEVLGFASAAACRIKPAYRYTVEDTI